jgi:hypothetical protein
MTFREACNYLESHGCLLVSTGSGTSEFSVSFGDVFGIVSEDGMRFYTDTTHLIIENFDSLESKKDIRRFKRTIHHYIGDAIIESMGILRFVERIVWRVFPYLVAMAIVGIIEFLNSIDVPYEDTVIFWLTILFMLLATIICPYLLILWCLFLIYAICSC